MDCPDNLGVFVALGSFRGAGWMRHRCLTSSRLSCTSEGRLSAAGIDKAHMISAKS